MASVRDVDELLNEVSLEDHSDEKLAQLILKEAAAVEKKMKEEEVDRKKYTHNLTWRGNGFWFYYRGEIVDQDDFQKKIYLFKGLLCYNHQLKAFSYGDLVGALTYSPAGVVWEPQCCLDVVHILAEFLDEDCLNFPRVRYSVKSDVRDFEMWVPYFLLLPGSPKERFDKTVVWLLVKVMKKEDVKEMSALRGIFELRMSALDMIRDDLYITFYLCFAHPTSWLVDEKQWWYKRLNNPF